MATETQVYDALQELMPAGVQFVDPYLDEVPTPLGDWAQMNIFDRTNIGWNQKRYTSHDEQTGKATYSYDVERIYHIQIDFYGENAYDNAGIYQQTLQQSLVDEDGILDLKTVGVVENRTYLQENKKYQKRYGFDIEVFVVDTITKESPFIDTIKPEYVFVGCNNIEE